MYGAAPVSIPARSTTPNTGRAPSRGRALKAAVGLGGRGSPLLAYGLLGATHSALGYAMLASAALWSVLLAPAQLASERPATRPDRGRET